MERFFYNENWEDAVDNGQLYCADFIIDTGIQIKHVIRLLICLVEEYWM